MVCGTESARKPDFFELIGLRAPRLDVGWEPSPADVINEMIGLAEVRSTDVVYDLGCGDGRTVITAAKRTGARGVGIDLDPRRIRECHKNGLREVGGLVRFLHADLFEADIGESTVLFLFLFPHVNLRLRPKLLTELRPGTKIVSYCHDMERWEPDRRVKIRTNYLYLWVLPANICGRWEGAIHAKDRRWPLHLELRQEFQMVSGTVSFGGMVHSLGDTALKGDTFSFDSLERPDGVGSGVILSGSVKADLAEGVIRGAGLPGETAVWTAQRDASTRTSLAR